MRKPPNREMRCLCCGRLIPGHHSDCWWRPVPSPGEPGFYRTEMRGGQKQRDVRA